ncbi:peptidylprolyl isomerase [Polaribacter sp.]|jgi:peptidylprolyl isomerase|nr:peptidylprolyl isomerase [Polaribacter sp.]MDA9363220.1 peptidylprolyl isomerase [Polaribacter sp.]MDB0026350.1 peptidylprolyl isomerase [Polaribacter sp.]MDB4167694.1 peptidylprolyl isomerase [Polaribacter sp.]MDB4202262.1 peptidylprolyl isomerase [Polaribacter sp.]
MKIVLKILLLLFFVVFYQCEKEKKAPLKKAPLKLEKKEKRIEKAWDSLNKHNVTTFLTAYGEKNKETKILIKTGYGNIKIRLFKDTPLHRANFIFLTKIKYFDTTVFYRVAKNFVLQGGNSDNFQTVKDRYKYGNYKLPTEFRKNRKHKYGALAAARDWKKNPEKLSSPFEFYIVQNRKGAHHLNYEHTVFGEVISGFDTMDKIAKIKVGEDEWPEEDVNMKVEILD